MADVRRVGRGVATRIRRAGRPLRHVAGAPLEPTFLIIGAQKAGTTSLFTHLSSHPDVAAPDTKEIDYFSCPSRHGRGPGFYHRHFPRRTTRTRVTFEASPDYLARTGTAERIHAYHPEMKLIAVLRDPVARAYSAWQMYREFHRARPDWYARWMRRCDATLGADAYITRPRSFGDDFAADLREELLARERDHLIEMPVIDHGMYHRQLAEYLSWFRRDQLLVESTTALRHDPVPVLRRVERFVGISANAWDRTALRVEYAGDYPRDVPPEARRILDDVYREPNRALRSLIDTDLGWS